MNLETVNQSFPAEYLSWIFLLTGLIMILSAFWKSTNSRLKQTGIPADGIVFEQESNNSPSYINNEITIRFVTKTGEWITGIIKQDFAIFYSRQYKDGDIVKLFYDQEKPSNFYVDTQQSPLTGKLIISLGGVFFLLMGLYKLFA